MQKNYNLLKKTLVFGIVVLFTGLIIPIINSEYNPLNLKNASVGTSSFNPFKEGWRCRKKVIINHNMVDGSHTNFPVLLSTIDTKLSNKAQLDGDDILFMDNKGEANQLFHEIEFYDGHSGELVAWVNIPSISSSSDTIFYMYYGNPDCSSQQLPEKVWNSNYCAVWHLHEDPTGPIKDSTMNNNDGFSYGYMTSSDLVEGIIGNCLDFDGNNDYISIPDSLSLKPKEVTLMGWFKHLEKNPPYGFFLSKKCHDYYGNADGHTYGFCWRGTNDTLEGGIEQSLPSPNQWAKIGHYPILTNNWYFLVLTFDEPSDTGIFYVNGTEEGKETQLHDSALCYNDPWDFLMGASRMHSGSSHTVNEWFKCQLDEVRVINIPLDPDWISTEYNNQNNPSGFIKISIKEIQYKTYSNVKFKCFFNRFPMLEKLLALIKMI